MHFNKLLITIISLIICIEVNAQPRLENKVYLPGIRSVTCFSSVADYSFPVIDINSEEHVDLSFDELKANNENYCYTMILCNSLWEPINMQPNEFLIGNAFEPITNYTFSIGTYQKYVHYSCSAPTETMKLKYAGNYIIKVYRNYNLDDIVLTQRCYVVNSKTNITNRIHRATNIDQRYTAQEVDIEVDISGATIPSPYTDAKLTIIQNGRFDNVVNKLTPKYINGNIYNYDYEDGNLFMGGNEFRAFDTRNIRSVGQNVSNKTIDTAIHINLKTDEARGSQQHNTLPDYNGKCLIANSAGTSANTLDYTLVTFCLNGYTTEGDTNLYVLGAFNNFQPSPECKMVYNEARKMYQCTILLKQGYYNYGYYSLQKDLTLDNSVTEGNHFETENDYYVFFYQKNYTYNFEELIGYQKANSGLGEKR